MLHLSSCGSKSRTLVFLEWGKSEKKKGKGLQQSIDIHQQLFSPQARRVSASDWTWRLNSTLHISSWSLRYMHFSFMCGYLHVMYTSVGCAILYVFKHVKGQVCVCYVHWEVWWLHSIRQKSFICVYSKWKVQINLSYSVSSDFPTCSSGHWAFSWLWPNMASLPLLCLQLYQNLPQHSCQWLAPYQWHHLWGTLLWHRTLH